MRIEFNRLRIIVIDDNAFMRRLIRGLLFGFGVREVYEAEDGASGLDSILAYKPDILITDWEMPILDGIEVTRLIRQQDASSNPFLPIILVTGYSEKARVIQARDAGVTEFLVKPISAKRLHDRILSVVAFPRPFIRTRTYFGPDRRRFMLDNFSGKERRREVAIPVDQSALLAQTAALMSKQG
jgi:two-component system chemotaxis response regulator CheY